MPSLSARDDDVGGTDPAMPPVDAARFRQAMARLGAAVHVVATAGADGSRHGLTATAVCSVTDTPPTLLACVNRSARARPFLREGGPICVNTLTHGQQAVSVAFSALETMEERFAVGDWNPGATGAPVLAQALASFDCVIDQVVEVGTHSVLFCAVRAIGLGDPGQALMYLNRTYHPLGG